LLTAVLLCGDAGLVAVVSVIWTAQARGQETTEDVAAFDLLGVNAAAGVVILALAVVAAVAATRGGGRTVATVAWSLAWLRLIAVPVTAVVIAVVVGAGSVFGLVETFVVGLAVLDAAVAVLATGTARRSTRG
jgi:hypothetical protein